MEGKDNKCDFFFLASFHSFSLLTQYVVASPPSIYPSHLELTTFVCKKNSGSIYYYSYLHTYVIFSKDTHKIGHLFSIFYFARRADTFL